MIKTNINTTCKYYDIEDKISTTLVTNIELHPYIWKKYDEYHEDKIRTSVYHAY